MPRTYTSCGWCSSGAYYGAHATGVYQGPSRPNALHLWLLWTTLPAKESPNRYPQPPMCSCYCQLRASFTIRAHYSGSVPFLALLLAAGQIFLLHPAPLKSELGTAFCCPTYGKVVYHSVFLSLWLWIGIGSVLVEQALCLSPQFHTCFRHLRCPLVQERSIRRQRALAEQSVALELAEEDRAAQRLLQSLHEQCQEEADLAARLAHVAREEAAMVENKRVLDE